MSGPYSYSHPRPAVTVDTAVFGFDGSRLHILLIRRAHAPFAGCWALPGGFLDLDEELETAATRELQEETGLTNVLFLEQIHTYGTLGRDPRGRTITIAYGAIVRGLPPVKGHDDADSATWIPIDAIHDVAFDHQIIIDHTLQWLRMFASNDLQFFKTLLIDEQDPLAAFDLLNALELFDADSIDIFSWDDVTPPLSFVSMSDLSEPPRTRKSIKSTKKKSPKSTKRKTTQPRRKTTDPPPK